MQDMNAHDTEHSDVPEPTGAAPAERDPSVSAPPAYLCDRCGFEMFDLHCKVVCPNCGARWDCSDLNIYTD